MHPHSENRSEARSNVFLAAALSSGSGTVPVRIRNLSPQGALVEGSSLPPTGSAVKLVRGHLEASGELAWKGGAQAGINFAGTIVVQAWVKRVGHSGQDRVDGVVSALRGSGRAAAAAPSAEPGSIAEVSAALDAVCEGLANFAPLSIDLGEQLLKLDAIAQSLRRLATGRPF